MCKQSVRCEGPEFSEGGVAGDLAAAEGWPACHWPLEKVWGLGGGDRALRKPLAVSV